MAEQEDSHLPVPHLQRIEMIVTDSLRGVEASKLMDMVRPRSGSEASFKEVLRRLDDLDFDMTHAGVLFKVQSAGTHPRRLLFLLDRTAPEACRSG